jgi:predicted nucleic acid-binding Zn ribbon protein
MKSSGKSLPKTSNHKTLAKTLHPEDTHQAFLDFVNLFPALNPAVQTEALFHTLGRWRKVLEPFASSPIPGTFDDFLDRHFPKAEFPRFRDYIENGDPRFPLATPVERWKWIASLSEALRVWAKSPHEDHEPSPWAKAGGWKPEGVCCVCENLFPISRKDRKTCSDKCANINRQREWRKKKESGVTKLYDAAKKRKQAKRSNRGGKI